MKVQMQGRKVAIEPLEKVNKSSGVLFVPESSDCTGLVKYIGTEYRGNLKVGQVVCYGDQRQRVKMVGKELDVMDSENIFAVLEEEFNSEENTQEGN